MHETLITMKDRLSDPGTEEDVAKQLYDLDVCPVSHVCMSCVLDACVVLSGWTILCQNTLSQCCPLACYREMGISQQPLGRIT